VTINAHTDGRFDLPLARPLHQQYMRNWARTRCRCMCDM